MDVDFQFRLYFPSRVNIVMNFLSKSGTSVRGFRLTRLLNNWISRQSLFREEWDGRWETFDARCYDRSGENCSVIRETWICIVIPTIAFCNRTKIRASRFIRLRNSSPLNDRLAPKYTAKTLANFDRVLRGTKAVKVSCVNETAWSRSVC